MYKTKNGKTDLLLPLVTALTALGLVIGCGGDQKESTPVSERLIKVVATTGMIADLAEHVGGSRVTVTGLMGPGVDPHLYKARASDFDLMSEADVIFYNGLHLEGAMTEVFEQMAARLPTVAVAENIEEDRLLSPPGTPGAHDPHVWFDVSLWREALHQVHQVLAEMDPDHTDLYRANTEAYDGELAALDEYVKEQAARVPEAQRVLITAHDAFNYFGRAYGFEVLGLQGISTASEAGTADIQSLAETIAAREIPAVFVESSVPKRNIEAVQEAVRSRGFEVGIGGELFSDAMGDTGTPEGTYVGMVHHNINTIVEALLGQ